MITLADLLLGLFTLSGTIAGIFVGDDRLGLFGGIGGAIVGLLMFGYIAGILGRWNDRQTLRRMRRELAPLSVRELRSRLSTSLTPNYILVELKLRGENISEDIETILRMLEHEVSYRRILGWAAFLSGFPQWADSIRGYNPNRSVFECQKKVAELRRRIETVQSPHYA